MRANEIIIERVINAFSNDLKSRYADEIWDIMEKSYASIGGFQSASSTDELINDTGLWKLVRRGDKITAAIIYKDKHGRKAIAMGTDGSIQGKRDYFMLTGDDVKLGRSWAEVSGAPEKIMARMGAEPIPAKYANLLTGKEILAVNPDGIHYTRLIAGHPHEKAIYGVAELEPAAANLLKNNGINLQDLPKNVKFSG